ncbi:tomoregulin-1-like isoform X1 [Lampetra planeri]
MRGSACASRLRALLPAALCCLAALAGERSWGLPAGLGSQGPNGSAPCTAPASNGTSSSRSSAAQNCTDVTAPVSNVGASVCDDSTCKHGGMCTANLLGNITCTCEFQCFPDVVPVCGSDGLSYQNECHLRQTACRLQRIITQVAPGPCYTELGSGSSNGADYEGSGSEHYRKSTKCGICLYGSECDEDAEDIGRCVCNIDCTGHNSNPVCASDGVSYENPCLVKEASCMKQQLIEVRFLGKCNPADSTRDQEEPVVRDHGELCPESLQNYCRNGQCHYSHTQRHASCICDPGFLGQQCESEESSMLYVIPDGDNLRYVLIASVVGAVQITITFALVVCVARRCPKNRRRR